MTQRITIYFVILFSILLLPYWLYIPMIIVAIFITPFFWEAILFGFFIDALYGYGVKFSTTSLMSVYALGALITVIVAMFFKERLRFNA